MISRTGAAKRMVKQTQQPKMVPREMVPNEHMQKLMKMVQKEMGVQEEEEPKPKKRGRKPKKKRGRPRKSKRVTKQEAMEEKLENMNNESEGNEMAVGEMRQEYVTMGKPSTTPPPQSEGEESEEKSENVFDVPDNVKHDLEHMLGKVAGLKTINGDMYVKVGDKVMKSVPPKVKAEGDKLVVKTDINVLRQYASMAKGGKVAVAINIGNNRSVLTVYVDKNGNIIVPPAEKKVLHVNPDGTITVDVEKALPKYFLKRLIKKGGGQLKVSVGYWGRFSGINAPVAGRTITLDVVPEEEE